MPTAPRRPVFPTAVFLGDSVTTGGRSLSHPRNRWTSLVCEHLRWREVNLAADGMGFFVRRGGHLPGGGRSPSCRDSTWLETAVRAEPDVLTVCLRLLLENSTRLIVICSDYIGNGAGQLIFSLKLRLNALINPF